ncbi:MAG: exonuclease domain-containing protein [Patescibacteria group bacterium]|nr:exonuclease domain-containing protein [Patescibacteria group bacterium]
MKFIKDILLIDFEVDIGDIKVAEPTQIGAILLDKETLEEKDSFVSYIAADLNGTIGKKSGITQEILTGAPTQAEVGKMIFEKFGTDILLGSWVAGLDRAMFRKIMTSAGIDIEQYDYHTVDLWPAAYIYLLKKGYDGAINSEAMFQELGMPPRDKHNALEDCRLAAEVLRKIIRD